jgi:hypothetical protein
MKTKNYYFYEFDKVWIWDPDPTEILGWIRIRIKQMRIRNTDINIVPVLCGHFNIGFIKSK